MILGSNGYLIGGLNNANLNEFFETFVLPYPYSQSRKLLFDSLINYFHFLKANYSPDEVWLDGSYVTNKANPGDIDLIVFLPINDFITARAVWGEHRANHPDLDLYYEPEISVQNWLDMSDFDLDAILDQRDYWLNQFGSDRTSIHKGIVRVRWSDIVDYLQGGVQ